MSALPLYSRIANDLALDIAKGRYGVGQILPTEFELAAQLQVSRATVRSALARLESRGLVSRRKNAGTRVEASEPVVGYGAELSSISDLLQWAQACRRHVQSSLEVVADAGLTIALGCALDSKWLKISSLRFDEGHEEAPVALTDAYLDPRYASALPTIKRQPDKLMSRILEKQFGLDLETIEQIVRATRIDRHQSEMLHVKPGEPALLVIRRYLTDQRQLALITVSTHPAKRFEIKTVLTRS